MEAIDALKQKILSLAIQGKLVPQDPNDEPASELLKKIKAEKAELVKQGKIKKDKQESRIFKGDDNKYYEQIGSEVRDITEEIPFDIPNSWEWVRFKDLFNIVSSKRVLQSDWKMEGIPFYRAREIAKLSDFGFVKNELYISEDLFVELSKSYLMPEENDIMVSAVGTIGKAYIVKATDRFYYKDASVLCYKNISKIIPEYVKLFMESECFVSQYSKDSGGTTVDTLTIVRANQYLIPLPPIKEQKRIVAEIEKIFEQIEVVKENQEELSKLKDGLKNKILDLAIQGKLVEQDPNDEPASELLKKIKAEKAELVKQGKIKKDKQESYIFKGDDNRHYEQIGPEVRDITDEIPFEIPNNWEWVRLGNIIRFVGGSQPAKQYFLENEDIDTIRLIQIRDYKSDKFKVFIPQSMAKRFCSKDDIMIGRYGPPLFQILRGIEGAYNVALMKADPIITMDKNFLYYLLKDKKLLRLLESLSDRTCGQDGVNMEALNAYIVGIPPIKEQQKIAKKIEIIWNIIDNL